MVPILRHAETLAKDDMMGVGVVGRLKTPIRIRFHDESSNFGSASEASSGGAHAPLPSRIL